MPRCSTRPLHRAGLFRLLLIAAVLTTGAAAAPRQSGGMSRLGALLGRGDFLRNLSVDVSSVALVELCRECGALYQDTCVEPWAGGYTDPSLSISQRSNYGTARERAGAGAPRGRGPAPSKRRQNASTGSSATY